MSQRAAFQVQLLEKLGAPLVSSVAGVSSSKSEGSSAVEEAGKVAELLNKAVQVSISLSGTMGLKDSDGSGDAVRLSLASVAGTLVANHYRDTGKVPGENDIGRMMKALEAVLTFSDNFVPAAETTVRLENIQPGQSLSDEIQIHVQYVALLAPVANAVAGFAFGQPEGKLAQDISDRLVERAETIRRAALTDADVLAAKQAELKILGALTQIYVSCHQAEVAKLSNMDEQARMAAAESGGGTMDSVWAAFDVRAGMVEALSRSMAGNAAGDSVAHAPVAAVPQEAPPVQPQASQVQEPPPPVQEIPPVSPPEEVAPQAAAPAAEEEPSDEVYNPMGFFKPGAKQPPVEEGGEGS